MTIVLIAKISLLGLTTSICFNRKEYKMKFKVTIQFDVSELEYRQKLDVDEVKDSLEIAIINGLRKLANEGYDHPMEDKVAIFHKGVKVQHLES